MLDLIANKEICIRTNLNQQIVKFMNDNLTLPHYSGQVRKMLINA